MNKKWKKLLGVIALTMGAIATPIAQVVAEDNATPQSNLYLYVNQEWLKDTEIPSDQPMITSFHEVEEKISETLREDIQKLVKGEVEPSTPELAEFVKLYKVASNFEQRDAEGIEPLKAEIEYISNITSVEDLSNKLVEMIYKGYPLPFGIGVGVNLEDTNQNMLELLSPGTLLPDKAYYENEEGSKQLLEMYVSTTVEVLKLAGYSQEDAKRMADNTVKFDALIVPTVKSSEEASEIENSKNERTLADVHQYSEALKMDVAIETIVGKVDVVNVSNPTYYEALATIVTDENLPMMKDWMTTQLILGNSSYLSEELRVASGAFGRMLSGVSEEIDKEEFVYDVATAPFAEVIGLYYAQTYFGEEARADVTEMVKEIIAVYKERLAKNDWLSAETREYAIKKLDAMKFFVGYPDQISEEYSKMKVDESKSLYANLSSFAEQDIKATFEHFNEPVNKEEWGMPAHMVNAFYNPTTNGIYFPAGILQAPFYSREQSDSANYGGIGAVIAHEITHAFDTNGAKFDADGNWRNWWVEEDFAKFEEKAQRMIEQWDGLEVAGLKVNGALSVTENIADAGGVSASLEALQKKEDADVKAFFLNWASVWRSKATPEVTQLLITTDTHAPNELRANVQAQNHDAFYEAFDVKPDDPMYMAPEKRIQIW